MRNIKLLARFGAWVDALCTKPQNVSGRLLAIMILWVGLLLVLSFMPGCATSAPVRSLDLSFRLDMYKTTQEVLAACHVDKTKPMRNLLGCRLGYSDGSTVLVVKEPTSWCDWLFIQNWGHELMHAAGYKHSKDFVMYYGLAMPWRGDACAFTEVPQ